MPTFTLDNYITTSDEDKKENYRKAILLAKEMDRKFTDEDVLASDFLPNGALYYLHIYKGNFDYMISMRNNLNKYHALYLGQVRGILNVLRAELARNEKEQNAEGFPQILDLFEKAKEQGLKRPRIRFLIEGNRRAVIYAAISTGKNPGCFYVKVSSDYAGMVHADGGADWRLNQNEPVKVALRALDNDPIKVLAQYGHETGECGICGKTLTDPISVSRGIGPVCLGRVGRN